MFKQKVFLSVVMIFFKMLFAKKYMKIIFFYFLKIIFDIKTIPTKQI